MANKYNAVNNMDARALFLNREVYKESALKDAPTTVVRDFWNYEDIYYGRTDASGNVVLPLQARLKPLPDTGDNILYALDFVVEAFRDFKRIANRKMLDGCLPVENLNGSEEPYIGPFKPKRAFRSTISGYSKRLNSLYPLFVEAYLLGRNQYQEVLDFDSFIKGFRYFLRHAVAGRYALNLSNYALSPSCCVLNTGLAIDISDDLSAGSDVAKEKNFIDNPRLKFYMNLAQEYGFYIDKNVPWRLVANLGSPIMQNYIVKHFPSYMGTDSLFEEYFQSAVYKDIDIIKNYMVSYYNRLVANRPVEMVPNNSNTCFIRHDRHRITKQQVFEQYNDDYWIETYVELRSLESTIGYDHQAVQFIIKNAQDLAKKVDNTRAIDYIDYKFRGVTSAPRSYAYDSISASLSGGEPLSAKEKEKIIKMVAQSENTVIY